MFGLKSFCGFVCCFETENVLKIKDFDPQSGGEPFDSEYVYGDEFVPAEQSESSKNSLNSLNESMAGLWCFLRDEVLLKYF
jgi:hypothetical protein